MKLAPRRVLRELLRCDIRVSPGCVCIHHLSRLFPSRFPIQQHGLVRAKIRKAPKRIQFGFLYLPFRSVAVCISLTALRVQVNVKSRSRFSSPIPLKELKSHSDAGAALEKMLVLRQPRVSVSPVTAAEWKFICALRP